MNTRVVLLLRVASCETWRHDGAAGTEDGTTELDRDITVVLLLLVARHSGTSTTELLVRRTELRSWTGT